MTRLFLTAVLLASLSMGGLAMADGPATQAPARHPATKKPELLPETAESAPLPAGDYGQIIFFPDTETRPSEERFKVQTGQNLPICIKLSKNSSAYVDRLRAKSIGFLLIMEDSSDPPHRLSIGIGNRLERLKIDDRGCFNAVWKIPQNVVPGIYQVSDLFWATSDESFYTLRNYLYEFSRVEELEIANSKADTQAPKLLRIVTYKKPPYKMQYYTGVLRIRIEQSFDFEDKESGLDKKSLRVFYKMAVDGQEKDLLDPACNPIPQTKRIRCVLNLTNPKIIWGLNQVTLTLDSIAIKDLAGNEFRIEGEDAIKEKVPGAQTSFEYERFKKWPQKPAYDLDKDPNVPPSRNF